MAVGNKELALTVAGIATWQFLAAYNANAPSLAEVRDAPPNDPTVKRQLLDADLLVGGTALVLGTTVAVMTKDRTALTVLLVMFGSTSLLHHWILAQEAPANASY